MSGIPPKMTKLIKTYEQFEIVKVPFPFTDSTATKVRPALVLSDRKNYSAKIGQSILTMITSVKKGQVLWKTDLLIEDIHMAGLPIPSIIRFKLFTLDHRLILGSLGTLGSIDLVSVENKLLEIFNLPRT